MKSVRTIIIFIGILIGMSNSMIMQTILTTSLPVISREFGTRAYYSWVYTGYILSSTVTIPVFGKICDKFGCRKNYIIGGAIFFMGTLGCGICSSMQTLVFSRIIMGIGSGMVIPATYGILSMIFKKEDMARVFAFMTIFQIVNNGLGSVLGSVFSSYFSWRYGMFLLIPVEIIGFAIVWSAFKGNVKMKSHDALGIKEAALFTSSLLFVMYALEKLSNSLSHINIEILIAALLLLIICFYYDGRKENGIIPREVKKSGTLKVLLVQIMFLGGAMNICLVYFPPYMVNALKISTGSTGNFLLVYLAALGAASFGAAYMNIGYIKIIAIGWISILIGSSSGIASFTGHSIICFTAAIFFIGLGVGILSSTIMADIQGEIHENPAASNGLAHLMRNFGGTLGVSIVQVFLFRQMNTLFIALFVMGTISLALLNLGNRNFSKRSE